MARSSIIKRYAFPTILVLLFLSIFLNIHLFQKKSKPDASLFETKVKEVIDGDTFITAQNIRMRLSNIEAPELPFCGGKVAKERLEQLIGGKPVRIVFAGEDIYNRSIVLVYSYDTLVNKSLLEEGFVRYDGSPSQERDALRDVYQQAVKEKKGIFGPPCRSENPDNSSCLIKGNINRNPKEKVYHFPGCSKYEQTVVEKDLGEQWFCTEKEAQSAGYTKAANCGDKRY